MNIIEALKSGKRFKRASQPNQEYWYHASSGRPFYVNDILAKDWEVESTPVIITREQFDAAWDKAIDESKARETDCTMLHHCLTKELGL